jgi:transcription initiation factor TFIIIB Brf1 subunit/transcription initiation factor TFIIB
MTNKKLRPNSAILADLEVVSDPETGELIRKDTGEVISDNMLSQGKDW